MEDIETTYREEVEKYLKKLLDIQEELREKFFNSNDWPETLREWRKETLEGLRLLARKTERTDGEHKKFLSQRFLEIRQ